MATARKIEVSALHGIQLHDGFLGEETLLRLIQHDNYKAASQTLANDRLRSFRDNYREFSRNIERLQRKNQETKVQTLISEWTNSTVSYLGYAGFQEKTAQHWEEGKVFYLSPVDDSHSVAIFFASNSESLTATIHDRTPLTSISGDVLSSSSRKETLCEQVEKAIFQFGISEAILITPNAVYYFRADSQVSGQCLECRWDEMLLGDNDHALTLATYLLRSEFFTFSESAVSDDQQEENETDGDEEEEKEAATGNSAKLTQSSELFRENLDQAREITEDLHKQVVLALELLINERLIIDPPLKKEALKAKSNEGVAHGLFKDGLFVLYRVLFILYAESRGLLPIENRRFSSFYSLEHLRDWAEDFLRKRNRGLGNAEGTYLWGAVKSIFTLLRRGVALPGGELVSPYNGQLFAPDRSPYFDLGPPLRDEAMAGVITALTRVGGSASARRLHFANLGVEQLGAVYEALLAQKPVIVREESTWVPAHGGGVGLVSRELALALEMDTFGDDTAPRGSRSTRRRQSSDRLERSIDPARPGFHPTIGKFIVAPLGGQKRQTASFYTPPKLAEFLVKRTLKPLAEGKTSKQILSLRLVEPAMGSGGFLIQVVRYLAKQLAEAKKREGALELRSGNKHTFYDEQRCKREIVENCIFGVDINPLAIELARTSLYLEALVPGEPLPFLHHRLKAGNSLIGADFQNRGRTSWEEGIEFPILFDIPVDHLKIDEKLWTAWDDAHPDKKTGKELKIEVDALKKKIKTERKTIGAQEWGSWANEAQHKITGLLNLACKVQEDFERAQLSNEIVDQLDTRYKDHLALIPDMDPVLIEAHGVEVDPILLKKRKIALLNEYGEKRYGLIVESQRAYTRLKALGDLATALWYWPLDQYALFPGYLEYKTICDWLLDNKSLKPTTTSRVLDKRLVKILRVAVSVGRELGFFHWQVEFSNVFSDPSRLGFSATISNPPWKVVSAKEKEIFPELDPQFLGAKPGKRAERKKTLLSNLPYAAQYWFEKSFHSAHFTSHWKSGKQAEIAPEGKFDLSVLFTLLSTNIIGPKGRYGLIVSRSALLVNSYTRTLREYLFSKGGLSESVSFVNKLSIFDIGTNIQFSLLIVEPKDTESNIEPGMVNGVIDLNTLDSIGDAFNGKASGSNVASRVIRLNMAKVLLFSKDTLAIPNLTDHREVLIAEALHKGQGSVVSIDQVASPTQGINQTEGPQNGFSEFQNKIPASEIVAPADILKGKKGKWVPLYQGRLFNLFDPLVTDLNQLGVTTFNQYGKRDKLERDGVDLDLPKVVWRFVARPSDQRTMIVSVMPPGFWCDKMVFTCQFRTIEQTLAAQCILGSLAVDFLARLVGSFAVTLGLVKGLPFPLHDSVAIRRAIDLSASLLAKLPSGHANWAFIRKHKSIIDRDTRLKTQAEIDALVWLHFGMNSAPLDAEHLNWMIGYAFPALNRQVPEYKGYVMAAYENLVKESQMLSGPTGRLFESSAAPVIEMDNRRINDRRGSKIKEPSEIYEVERRKGERRVSDRKRG